MKTYKTTLYPWFSLQQVCCNDKTAKNDDFIKCMQSNAATSATPFYFLSRAHNLCYLHLYPFIARIGNGGLYFFAYPNMMINRYGKWLELNICTPVEYDKTSVSI